MGEEMARENALHIDTCILNSGNQIVAKPGRIVLHPATPQLFGFCLQVVFHDFQGAGSAKATNETPPQSSQTPALTVNWARQRGQYERQELSLGIGGCINSAGSSPVFLTRPCTPCFRSKRISCSVWIAAGSDRGQGGLAGYSISRRKFAANLRKSPSAQRTLASASG